MSQDKNDPLDVILNELLPYFLAADNSFMLGKVISIDKGSPWRVDVQPSPKQSDGNERAIIGDCLVLESAASTMKRGSSVLVGFHDRDMDNYNGAGEFELASRRMHDVNDGIVLGVIKSE